MGCACAKPVPIEDSRESPRVVRQVAAPPVVPAQGIPRPKLSASSDVPSSRREESVPESKAGKLPFRPNDLDGDMRRERQLHPGYQQLRMIGSIPKAAEGEQVSAGWPAWLVAVAGEAIRGWVPRRADSFEKLDKIGQGTYSSVYRARDLDNGKIVALKKVRFDSLEPESVRFMAREIHILRKLDHPNIVKLEGLVTSRMSCSLYLVFEYMEHDLAGLASFPGIKFTEPQVKCYMQQLLRGLDYCHSRGILHRDVKGSNLLIDNNGILKIADFGLASFFDSERPQQLTSRVVTLWYRPPELLLGATNYDVAVDLWSAGCILAELYAGKPIMPGRTEVEQLHKIFKLCGSPSDDYWRKAKLPHATIFKPQQPYKRRVLETFENFPAPALALMEVLLSVDPAERGTAASALKSEYFTTMPLPCDPSMLPKYPPSKELDAKLREEEARRQGAAGGKVQRPEIERGGLAEFRAAPAPDANAELSASIKRWKNQGNSQSRSEKFNPHHEEAASGFPIEPPRPARALEADELSHRQFSRKTSHSGPLVNQGQRAAATKHDDGTSKQSSAANLSALSGLMVARRNTFLENGAQSGRLSESGNEHLERRYDQLYHGVSQRKGDESGDKYMNQSLQPGFGPKGNKIHYSGPLPRPSGNVDQILKDHDRQIQEAVRRSRIDRSKARKLQGDGTQGGPSIRPYNLGVVPVYPSSRSSVIVFTSSRGGGAMQQHGH